MDRVACCRSGCERCRALSLRGPGGGVRAECGAVPPTRRAGIDARNRPPRSTAPPRHASPAGLASGRTEGLRNGTDATHPRRERPGRRGQGRRTSLRPGPRGAYLRPGVPVGAVLVRDRQRWWSRPGSAEPHCRCGRRTARAQCLECRSQMHGSFPCIQWVRKPTRRRTRARNASARVRSRRVDSRSGAACEPWANEMDKHDYPSNSDSPALASRACRDRSMCRNLVYDPSRSVAQVMGGGIVGRVSLLSCS